MLKMKDRTNHDRSYLIKNVPSFKPFLLHICEKEHIFRSVLSPSIGYDFLATIAIPLYISFEMPSNRDQKRDRPCSVVEVGQRFEEFALPITNQAISLYTDGSKEDHESPVGAAVFSRDLGIVLKHKLPAGASIFSAEVWAIYQSLIMVESANKHKAVIFSDSKSVLDAVTSSTGKKCSNYLIPLIKLKYHSLSAEGFSIQLVWIPSHVGIVGNEEADAAAKRAARNGHKFHIRICTSPSKDAWRLNFAHCWRKRFVRRVLCIFRISFIYHLSRGSINSRFAGSKSSPLIELDQTTTI